MDYPRAIKELRERRFLTQEELAKLLHVSFISVNRWENGHFEPTMKIKRKLNQMFIESNIKENANE